MTAQRYRRFPLLFSKRGDVAVTGQALFAANGQILVAANIADRRSPRDCFVEDVCHPALCGTTHRESSDLKHRSGLRSMLWELCAEREESPSVWDCRLRGNLGGGRGDGTPTVWPVSVLSDVEVESFIQNGFVRLERAFPAAVARRCVDDLWALLDEDRCDRSTWINPVARVAGTRSDALDAAINTDRLCGAIDDLVGAGRWQRRLTGYGSFPIRFPSDIDPGDAGWHVDGSYPVGSRPPPWNYWVNHRSRGRALLLLMLFTDVTKRDAPTRVRVGSHVDVARVVPMFGEAGGSFVDVTESAQRAEGRSEALATGAAGDVYLCHPFLVHTASWPHRGQSPRFIGQPPIEFVPGHDGYQYDDARLDRSPCAEAIRRAQAAI